MTNLSHIVKTETENTGGHCMVDILTLKDGRILTVSGECLCVWRDMEHWIECSEGAEPQYYTEI